MRMTGLHCLQIGGTARRLLVPGARGCVLAGFSRAAYLRTEQGECLWLAAQGVPRHTRALCVAGPLPRLAAGTAFSVAGRRMAVGGDLAVDFAGAATWSAPPVVGATPPAAGDMRGRLERAFAACPDPSTARGLGRLIPGILALAHGERGGAPAAGPILALAWPAVRAIAVACLSRDPGTLWREAAALVGLGEGLTPSGDDLLGGLMFSLHTVRQLCPDLAPDPAAQARFLAAAEGRTHPISYALLRDLAAGQAAEPLHAWMRGVVHGAPAACMRALARDVIGIGHTSGWDLLAGALTGLLPAFPCAPAEAGVR